MSNLIATRWRSVALALLGFSTYSSAFARMSEGAEIYKRHCVVCHGVNGDGHGLSRIALVLPPRDFTTEDARRALTREYMIVIVRDGRPNTPMHGRKTRLTQSQIESVVDFVRAAFMRPEPGTSLARGYEIHQAMCASCHSDRGQGSPTVPGKPFSPLSATARAFPFTQAQVLAAIARPGHGVPAGFAATLPEPDIDALAKFIASAYIDPYRPGTKPD
jgi:mono/diheme cytochrome c family protein